MLGPLSQRLLVLLQFTRMALVFTAVSNGWAALLLRVAYEAGERPLGQVFNPFTAIAMAGVSVGLYAFGMTLNDIIDRRRDTVISAERPLPSGRLGLQTAHVLCGLLATVAFAFGAWLAGLLRVGDASLVLVVGTLTLIVFYNLAGKYLVAAGLLTLGLIRFFHAAVPAPMLPLVWHPLFLLVHTSVLSTVCYYLEQKRPALSRRAVAGVATGLAVFVGLILFASATRHLEAGAPTLATALSLDGRLLIPLSAGVIFLGLAVLIRQRTADARAAGKRIMLVGLLWLIVYDVAFVGLYVSTLAAGALLLLLPLAYMSVQVMRGWAKAVELTRPPEFQRAR